MNMVRTLLRWVKHAPDRLLHPMRRRTAMRRVRRSRPQSILVLCYGNICRSPYAGAVLAARLSDDGITGVDVDSAGFAGPGRSSPDGAVRVAGERGTDLSPHRSRLVTLAMLKDADLVLVMDARQRRAVGRLISEPPPTILLGDLDPQVIDTRAVRDPVEQPDGVFRESYDRIDRCVDALVQTLRS